MKEITVPLPPIDKQRRIAAILDQADALRAKRRAALAKLDGLTQSIFLDMFGDPITNRKGWRVVPLTEVCTSYSGGTPSSGEARFWHGPIPWFSAKDIKKKDLFDSEDHISEEGLRTHKLRLLQAGTVVIVVRGMILAHTFPVSVLRIPATINQDLKALLPRVPLNAQFLATNLRCQTSHVLAQVSEAGHGTKRLDIQGLRNIRIIIPPEEMQAQFVRLASSVETLRTHFTAAVLKLDALFASLQHRAFRGEL